MEKSRVGKRRASATKLFQFLVDSGVILELKWFQKVYRSGVDFSVGKEKRRNGPKVGPKSGFHRKAFQIRGSRALQRIKDPRPKGTKGTNRKHYPLSNTPLLAAPTPAPTPGMPVDCIVSVWSSWTPCNAKTATQSRQRNVIVSPTISGSNCPDDLTPSPDCAARLCR